MQCSNTGWTSNTHVVHNKKPTNNPPTYPYKRHKISLHLWNIIVVSHFVFFLNPQSFWRAQSISTHAYTYTQTSKVDVKMLADKEWENPLHGRINPRQESNLFHKSWILIEDERYELITYDVDYRCNDSGSKLADKWCQYWYNLY